MMTEKRCKFIKSNGKQCEAWAMKDSNYCFLHNPDISDKEKKTIQSKGGQANKIKVLKPLPPIKINHSKDIVLLLEDTINKVRGGEMDLKVANCLGYLAGHLIKAIEIAKLEDRIETVERVILERRTT